MKMLAHKKYRQVSNDHVARNYAQGGGDRETIREFHRVRSSMTRARLEHVPAVSHDINDVFIRGLWKRTWSRR